MGIWHHGKVDVVYLAEHLMGSLVRVNKLLIREIKDVNIDPKTGRGDSYYFWKSRSLIQLRTGWVVGIRHLQEGEYYPAEYECQVGSRYMVEQAGIKVVQTVPALQVCFWPTTRSFHVPLDGWTTYPGMRSPESPGIRPLPDLGCWSGDFYKDVVREDDA